MKLNKNINKVVIRSGIIKSHIACHLAEGDEQRIY